jgi:adenylate kinase
VRLVLLGPPGVGKGTQGRRLAADCGWALISTGEILRESVARGTALGLEARKRIEAGLLVPDDVMIGLVRERSAAADAAGGFVLDGFPRTVPQADALDVMLTERGFALDMALALMVPQDELVRRLSGRRECPVCKRAYHDVNAPAKDGMHCDDHPMAALRQRADDAEETVRKRLEVYWEQTAPLVDYYRRSGRLQEIQGVGSMNDVYAGLRRIVGCDREARGQER